MLWMSEDRGIWVPTFRAVGRSGDFSVQYWEITAIFSCQVQFMSRFISMFLNKLLILGFFFHSMQNLQFCDFYQTELFNSKPFLNNRDIQNISLTYFFNLAILLHYCLAAKSCPTLLWPHELSMGFSRQEYWSEFPFPSPGDLPDLGIKPMAPAKSPTS